MTDFPERIKFVVVPKIIPQVCPDCGEDSLTVDGGGYTVYCMECDYSNNDGGGSAC